MINNMNSNNIFDSIYDLQNSFNDFYQNFDRIQPHSLTKDKIEDILLLMKNLKFQKKLDENIDDELTINEENKKIDFSLSFPQLQF